MTSRFVLGGPATGDKMDIGNGQIYNGIILNGVKYEAVKARNDDDTICEHCALSEECDKAEFDICALFDGAVHFRIRRNG